MEGLHNCIPVGDNQIRKGIRMEGMSLQCGEPIETVEHLFFHCPKTQLIWRLAPVSWEGLDHATDSFKAWWMEQDKSGKVLGLQDKQELTAFIMWQVWKARNALYIRGENWAEKEIIERACEEWQEGKALQQKDNINVVRRVMITKQKCWEKPEQGKIKFNICSDNLESCGGVGLGVVARDDQGHAVQMWSVTREGYNHPVVTDLDAVRIALLFT